MFGHLCPRVVALLEKAIRQERLVSLVLMGFLLATPFVGVSGPLPTQGFQPILNSGASKLAYTDSMNGVLNIFILDLTTGVSQRITTLPEDASKSANHSYAPRFLGQSNALVFESLANGLISADDNNRSDVFIHRLEDGRNESISLLANGNAALGSAQNVEVSADGHWIAFRSDATGLIPLGKDPYTFYKTYLYHTPSRTFTFASTNRLGRSPLGSTFVGPLSADGQRLLFRCETNDITRAVTSGVITPWYWRDNRSGSISMIRLRTNGTLVAIPFECHALSGDGRFAIGSSTIPNASSGFSPGIYRVSLDTNSAALGHGFSNSTGIPNTVPRFTSVHDVQVNHDGSRIVVSGFLRTNAATVTTQRGAILWEPNVSKMTPLLRPMESIPSGAVHSVTLSPQGDRIAYVHSPSGLWVVDSAFKPIFGPVKVDDFPAPSFSPDGRWLTFQSPSPSATPQAPGRALFVIDLEAAAIPTLSIQSTGVQFVIRWDSQIPNMNLEFADSLKGDGWQKVSPTEAGRYVFTPSDSAIGVFRLSTQ